MNKEEEIKIIINEAINSVLPEQSVERILNKISLSGKIHIIAIGKAAWRMASATQKWLSNKDITLEGGICITKYEHSQGPIKNIQIFEAGHPSPDENTILATQEAIKYAESLNENDTVLFLVSGGGSALFECPTVSLDEYKIINDSLLADGSSIEQINEKRKKYSKVKGGKFANICSPAKIINIILSDVLGDNLSAIASGPTIAEGVDSYICGNVEGLCEASKITCEKLGYKTKILTQNMIGIARTEANWFAYEALEASDTNKKVALIAGGETVVELTGNGKGGRNQEFALASAPLIEGKDIVIFSVGSDGTDGPTDAAGGFSTGKSMDLYRNANINIKEVLQNNDSYNALKVTNQLIITGPTGTNVNDVAVALVN